MKRFDLNGRTALVTGSTKGIGRGIADAMQECNARVLFHGRARPDDLPAEATCLNADLMQPEASEQLLRDAFAAAPELDILVCNAGSFFDVPFLEMTREKYENTLDLNVRAPYFLVQAFAQKLVEQKRGGAVVIVGSTNGFQAEHDSTAYDTSKGALVMMTKSFALDLAQYSIRVNCLAPGLIRTPLTERWLDTNHAARAHYEKNVPLGRIGAIEDCGAATAFLVSEAASFITGHVLVVDGGLTLSQIDVP
jgi:NAD(P)-dependent dehydrogenase (short-subunit alcohol dehydrogenase family)